VGRLIVDMEVSAAEVDAIQSAIAFMEDYHVENNLPDSTIPPLIFNKEPIIQYADYEKPPIVRAVCELFGVAVTQGIYQYDILIVILCSYFDLTQFITLNRLHCRC